MKSIFKIALLLTITSTFYNCKSDDETATYVVRDRAEVYKENKIEIEAYLKANYMTIGANNEVTVTKIPENGTQTSIWDQYKSTLFNNEVPFITIKNDARNSLLTDGRIVDAVDYKMHYIVLNQGGGETPTSVDSTFVSYKGWNLKNEVFDQNNSGTWFSFPDVNTSISGFRQVLSQIKTASSFIENTTGSITYNDYGNVVVFIPSGLAYFSSGTPNIGTYAPIAFQIKLFSRKERDHERDRVSSKYEDLNNNNDYFDDDTDGDKLPDFIDVDDDGDGFLTKFEITKPTPLQTGQGISLYYPFNHSATEPKGIPDKNGDGTTQTRLRRHVDKNTKPPYTVY
jgi:FKBP-type peptidyl-prolyl cis-trans isomerase FkpA